ncbi:fructokinase [Chitinophaga costaii]|uniref:Fructokinase n=1 Tax=Chitinophaga costaii TaxID=1335309 RepID=A0A1C4CN55_9BACT|nr:carbohydrate kinase [Chitinophaga costaii]PUZ27022.1 carbohydrate kinase [Chitinophaga costaii]SCC20526.1 fructokinase [Chitinophaga costaii]
MDSTVVSFGEVLWDIFPHAARIGGAPLNVAYNLTKQGISCTMISRIGRDERGEQLRAQLQDWQMPVTGIQQDEDQPTGTVIAGFDAQGEPHYDIIQPAAWDYITWQPSYEAVLQSADAFIFGSLSARHAVTRKTLFTALETARVKVFDVNLRTPFYSFPLIRSLLEKANILKVSLGELKQILTWLDKSYIAEADGVHYLQDVFKIPEILLTKGVRGSVYYAKGYHQVFAAVPVTVQDTVGSGDAFLAGFLASKLQQQGPLKAMQNAALLSAFITSREGACPPYSFEEYQQFVAAHPL